MGHLAMGFVVNFPCPVNACNRRARVLPLRLIETTDLGSAHAELFKYAQHVRLLRFPGFVVTVALHLTYVSRHGARGLILLLV